MHLRLHIQPPNDGRQEFSTHEETTLIGRDPNAPLRLSDANNTVSWHHARIDLTPGGASIQDLGSTNGTALNGKPLSKGRPAPLRPRDVIQFGKAGPRLQVIDLDLSPASASASASASAPVARTEYVPMPAPAVPDPVRPRPQVYLPEPAAMPASYPPSPAGSQTRLMLMQTQQRFRYFAIFAAAGAAAAVLGITLIVGVLLWQSHRQQEQEARQKEQEDRQKEQEAKLAQTEAKLSPRGQDVYQQAIASTVWVRNYRGGKVNSHGTGVLIDRERRLVATAYHVIRGSDDVEVFFPKYRDGHLLTMLDQYAGEWVALPPNNPDSIRGKVWASDPKLDLAIVELLRLPAGVPPLKLAADSPATGTHTIALGAHPVGSGGMWVYNEGAVKEVTPWSYPPPPPPGKEYGPSVQKISCMMISTQNPINHGNSGGPLVNEHGELIGIASLAFDDTKTYTFVDVRHVKEVLSKRPHEQ